LYRLWLRLDAQNRIRNLVTGRHFRSPFLQQFARMLLDFNLAQLALIHRPAGIAHNPVHDRVAPREPLRAARLEAGNYPVIPDGWVACSERMPEKFVEVLVCTEDGSRYVAAADPSTVLALLDELEAAEKRIAELEAKKVKIKLPESFYPDGDIDCPLVINEYQIIEAIVAADCKPIAVCPRCKCELDLSHKPDGAHFCHPDAAGKGEAS
jgi:hypothetical protein